MDTKLPTHVEGLVMIALNRGAHTVNEIMSTSGESAWVVRGALHRLEEETRVRCQRTPGRADKWTFE